MFVLGLQWGDEGKGKIVDLLSENFSYVVRFQGGNNAGHTLVIDGQKYRFSMLPSGVMRKSVKLVIAGGVVVDPDVLLGEIESVKELGLLANSDSLSIMDNCHIILGLHKDLDKVYENWRQGSKIGTTCRGIGPCYEDKVARRGIRLCDLQNEKSLYSKLEMLLLYHNKLREGTGLSLVEIDHMVESLLNYGKLLQPYTKPVHYVNSMLYKESKSILFEGAQGLMLDIDYGTYPFVTSSSVVLGCRSGVYVLGVAKAYCTRVGNGSFISEDSSDMGKKVAVAGDERGTVTGRARRCGWLDLVMLKYAVEVVNVSGIALTKVDVLSGLSEVKVCVGYKKSDVELDYLPSLDSEQENVVPMYNSLPGWDSVFDAFGNLSEAVKSYIAFIESFIGVPVAMVSYGPERKDCIFLKKTV